MNSTQLHVLLRGYQLRLKEVMEQIEDRLPEDIPRQKKKIYIGNVPPVARPMDDNPDHWKFQDDPEGIPIPLLPLHDFMHELNYDVQKTGKDQIIYLPKEKD